MLFKYNCSRCNNYKILSPCRLGRIEMRKKPKIRVKSIVVAIGILLVIIAVPGIYLKAVSKSKSEIITTSTLEKIINVNDLSTYESMYNGVTQVMNEKKPDKVDYYVSYKAKVKAGIDFKK